MIAASLRCLVLSMGLFLLQSVLFAQVTPPTPPGLDARVRAADPRLAVPVTIDADRVYLGEFLERLSAQTGVSISIPATELASGTPITCHLKQVPLGDVLSAIWSQFSYLGALWQISVDTSQHPPAYQLLPTDAARALPNRLRSAADQASEHLLDVYLKIASLVPQERRVYTHELAEALQTENESVAQAYIDDANLWARVGMAVTAMSPEQREQLRQGNTILVPYEKLNLTDQSYVRSGDMQHHVTQNGVPVEYIPDRVKFTYDRNFGMGTSLARDLTIGVGDAHRMISQSSMGMLDLALNRSLVHGWVFPGEKSPKPVNGQVGDVLLPLWEQDPVHHSQEDARLLTQLADAGKISYIGVLPTVSHLSMSNLNVSGMLGLNMPGIMHKWHNGVLLCSYALWFYGDEGQYPYAAVKQLRERRERNAGRTFTLPDIADVVAGLTDAQAERLAKEFPQVGASKKQRPFLTLYKNYPQMLSEEGVATDLNMIALLKTLKLMPSIEENASLDRLRIREDPLTSLPAGGHLYWFDYQSGGQWKHLGQVTILPDGAIKRRLEDVFGKQ